MYKSFKCVTGLYQHSKTHVAAWCVVVSRTIEFVFCDVHVMSKTKYAYACIYFSMFRVLKMHVNILKITSLTLNWVWMIFIVWSKQRLRYANVRKIILFTEVFFYNLFHQFNAISPSHKYLIKDILGEGGRG